MGRKMRALALGAFVLDGAAAVAFVALVALGDGRMTAVDAFILAALLLGFFCALACVVLTEQRSPDETAALILTGAAMFDRLSDAAKRDLRQHFPQTAEVAGPGAVSARAVIGLSVPE